MDGKNPYIIKAKASLREAKTTVDDINDQILPATSDLSIPQIQYASTSLEKKNALSPESREKTKEIAKMLLSVEQTLERTVNNVKNASSTPVE